MGKIFLCALLSLPGGWVSATDFDAKMGKVCTLSSPSKTQVTSTDISLVDGIYVCKIKVRKDDLFTLWTSGLETNSAASVTMAVSSSIKNGYWSASTVAKTTPDVSIDDDQNHRATLRLSTWNSSDAVYVNFYFQFKGVKGTRFSINYQGAVVEQIVTGTKARPEEFSPYDSATPATWYDVHTGNCLTNGEYWLSATLQAGMPYRFGVGTNSTSSVQFKMFDTYGAPIDEPEIENYDEWSCERTNIMDVATCLTNILERLSVVVECQTKSNTVLMATNVYTFAGVYTNDTDGTWTMQTNLLTVVTNVDWTADSISYIVSTTTNLYREVLSVQTNIVTVTNVQHVGDCREAWKFVPRASGTYKFCFRGDSKDAFVLIEAMFASYVRVDFSANGGTVSEAKCSYVEGAPYSTFPTAARANCEFTGWYTDAEAGDLVVASDYASASITNLHAHWNAYPYLSVEKVGDTENCSVTPSTTVCASSGTLVTLSATASKGRYFAGWYGDRNCSEAMSSENPYAFVMPEEGTNTVYARFISKAMALAETVVLTEEEHVVTAGVYVAGIPVAVSSPLPTTVSVSGLPSGLTFSKGVISGSVRKSSTKPIIATVKAVNSSGKVTKKITFDCVGYPLPAIVVATVGDGTQAPVENYSEVNLTVGMPLVLSISPEMPASATAAMQRLAWKALGRMPSGLRLSKGVISGTPVVACTNAVVIVGTNSAGWETRVSLVFSIAAMPEWSIGTFDGVCSVDGASGVASMTVTKTGKISGRMNIQGKRYSFSSSSLDKIDVDGSIHVHSFVKIGTVKYPFDILLSASEYDTAGDLIGSADVVSTASGIELNLGQNIWKQKNLNVPKYTRGLSLSCGDVDEVTDLKLTWRTAGNGVATYVGTRNGRKVTGTAQSVLCGYLGDGCWMAQIAIPTQTGAEVLDFVFEKQDTAIIVRFAD